jgi:3-oxoacyl-[acyl-carrier protein] reductase
MTRVVYDFAGTTVLVTGGTSGIGHATAVTFRDAGAAVTVTGTKPTPNDYDVDLSGMTYRQLVLTDHAAIDAFAQVFSTLDVLINNAGANFPGGLDEARADGFTASVELNLVGPARLTLALHRALKASPARGGASTLMLGSMAALRAVPLVPGYGSAKAGMLALTRNLAMRWAGEGIRVNAVIPGVIDTPMTAPMNAVPEIKRQQLDHIPIGRLGTPAEIASAIVFLCSENASYITGSALVVDGGYSLL